MKPDLKQTLEVIESYRILERTNHMKLLGYRLMEMHCTRLTDGTELNYAFDRDGDLVVLRARVADDETVPSITGMYSCAFLYENEMQDLFGIKVSDLHNDYRGHFYKLKKKTPYRPDPATDGQGG